VIQNTAKEFRDRVMALYDELICVKISDILTSDTGEGIFSKTYQKIITSG
jgi:hypothetical protein